MTEENIKTGAIVLPLKPNEDYVLPRATTPFNWDIGYEVAGVKDFKVKDQHQSFSCGGNSTAYYTQVLLDLVSEQSARFIYAFSYQAPNGGASYYSLGSTICTRGSCDESLAPSYHNGTTDEDFMRSKDFPPEAYTDGLTKLGLKYAKTEDNSIDTIASAIQEHGGVVLGIYGQNNNTWLTENPQPPISTKDRWCHWVFAYKAYMKNGKKTIRFINSWGDTIGDKGHQEVNENYFTSVYGIYMAWSITPKSVIIPKYKFSKPMVYGEKSKDVTYLQKRLAEEGYNQPITGYYGDITAKNVLNYQIKNHVAPMDELSRLAGKRVGNKTILCLNQ